MEYRPSVQGRCTHARSQRVRAWTVFGQMDRCARAARKARRELRYRWTVFYFRVMSRFTVHPSTRARHGHHSIIDAVRSLCHAAQLERHAANPAAQRSRTDRAAARLTKPSTVARSRARRARRMAHGIVAGAAWSSLDIRSALDSNPTARASRRRPTISYRWRRAGAGRYRTVKASAEAVTAGRRRARRCTPG